MKFAYRVHSNNALMLIFPFPSLLFTARYGWAQLLLWWTLPAHIFLCESMFFNFYPLLVCNFHSCLPPTFSNWMTVFWLFSDARFIWHCKLVSDTCWLVWRKMASKIIQSSRYYLWALEKHYCMFLLLSILHKTSIPLPPPPWRPRLHHSIT